MSAVTLISAIEFNHGWIAWFEEIPLLGGIGRSLQEAFEQLFEVTGQGNTQDYSIVELTSEKNPDRRIFHVRFDVRTIVAAHSIDPPLRLYEPAPCEFSHG